jgi:hypothetical protein
MKLHIDSVLFLSSTTNLTLLQWSKLPHAKQAHPREEHLIPLLVAAAAGGTNNIIILFDLLFDLIIHPTTSAVVVDGTQNLICCCGNLLVFQKILCSEFVILFFFLVNRLGVASSSFGSKSGAAAFSFRLISL